MYSISYENGSSEAETSLKVQSDAFEKANTKAADKAAYLLIFLVLSITLSPPSDQNNVRFCPDLHYSIYLISIQYFIGSINSFRKTFIYGNADQLLKHSHVRSPGFAVIIYVFPAKKTGSRFDFLLPVCDITNVAYLKSCAERRTINSCGTALTCHNLFCYVASV